MTCSASTPTSSEAFGSVGTMMPTTAAPCRMQA